MFTQWIIKCIDTNKDATSHVASSQDLHGHFRDYISYTDVQEVPQITMCMCNYAMMRCAVSSNRE
jgi:hypothetical protein